MMPQGIWRSEWVMLHDIIVEKINLVFKRNIYNSSIIRQEKKVGGGLRFLTGCTQEGGGSFRCVLCATGGSKNREKMRM